MPFADPEQRREYDTQYKRERRAGVPCPPRESALPADFRTRTAKDIVELLADEITGLRENSQLGHIERSRLIGTLCSVLLRAVEAADIAGRVEALESVLKSRPKTRKAA